MIVPGTQETPTLLFDLKQTPKKPVRNNRDYDLII